MVGRSITLLTMSKRKNIYKGISMAFSKKILNALEKHGSMRVSVPLFFKHNKQKHHDVYVTHNHKTGTKHVTKHEHKHISVQNDVTPDMQTANNFFYKQENISNKKINYIQNARMSKLFSYNYRFDEKKFSSESHNKHNNTFVFTSKIDKKSLRTIQNQDQISQSFIYSAKNETSLNKSVLQKVQNLVYKSENTTEVRLEQIENNIINLTKVINKPKTLQNSQKSGTNERVTYNMQLQEMSEKVYALVMKKYNSEQRRKGNLYA